MREITRAFHMEAAIIIEKFHSLKKVIEYGAGMTSTPWFLDKVFFPNLEILYSIETEEKWIHELNKEIIEDKRWKPIIVPDEQRHLEGAEEILESDIDLILVDSLSIKGRIHILTDLSEKQHLKYIVLHDSQHKNYNSVKKRFSYIIEMEGKHRSIPDATILSNQDILSELNIPKL